MVGDKEDLSGVDGCPGSVGLFVGAGGKFEIGRGGRGGGGRGGGGRGGRGGRGRGGWGGRRRGGRGGAYPVFLDQGYLDPWAAPLYVIDDEEDEDETVKKK